MAFADEFAALRDDLKSANIPEQDFLAVAGVHRITWSRWATGVHGVRYDRWTRVRSEADRLIAEKSGQRAA